MEMELIETASSLLLCQYNYNYIFQGLLKSYKKHLSNFSLWVSPCHLIAFSLTTGPADSQAFVAVMRLVASCSSHPLAQARYTSRCVRAFTTTATTMHIFFFSSGCEHTIEQTREASETRKQKGFRQLKKKIPTIKRISI